MPKRIVLVVALVVTGGCRSGGVALPMLSSLPGPDETIAVSNAGEQSSPFSFRRAMQLVGFSPSYSDREGMLPNELIRLGSTINAVALRANELNVNDPTHVTVEKARAIFESLQPFDAALSAAKSLGLVDAATAQPLELIVQQLRLHTQHLLQFGSQPETIAAIQQLAGQLMTGYAQMTRLFGGMASQPPA